MKTFNTLINKKTSSYITRAALFPLCFVICFCSKYDKVTDNFNFGTALIASIDTSDVATKTLHSHSNKALKTSWVEGDEIAVWRSTTDVIYKFTQTGAIKSDGHNTNFICNETLDVPVGEEVIAVYPYSSDLSYSIKSQTGKIEDLKNVDILLAKQSIDNSGDIHLKFSPICAIIRFPKDLKVSNETNSGNITYSFSGERVANGFKLSNNGSIEPEKGAVQVSASVNNGVLADDLYLVFYPIETGNNDLFYLDSENGDHFEFYRSEFSTTKLYNVNSVSDGIVEFEDAKFKEYCVNKGDANNDGEISFAEALTIKGIYCENRSITSLEGIQAFKNLQYLHCEGNKLTQIDLSKNTNLQYLYCNNNQLTQIDLGENTNLIYLYCYSNKLTQLDLSKNTALQDLRCFSNQLTQLDLSKNTNLQYLSCNNNQLTQIDVSKNTKLQTLSCFSNQLTQLDLSGLFSLRTLNCYNNPFTNLVIKENTSLRTINIPSVIGRLEINKTVNSGDFNVSFYNGTGPIKINTLRKGEFRIPDGTKITNLIIKDCHNPLFNVIRCESETITNLIIKDLPLIDSIYCIAFNITVSNLHNFTSLDRGNVGLGSTGSTIVSSCPNLKFLSLPRDNKTIDLTDCHNLIDIWGGLDHTNIESSPCLSDFKCDTLNINNFSRDISTLRFSNVEVNQMTLSNVIPHITISASNISNLAVSNNSATKFDFRVDAGSKKASNCQFSLDGCPKLDSLRFYAQVPALSGLINSCGIIINNCPSLKVLSVNGSRGLNLTEFDFSKCANLQYLSCNDTQLTQLDVSKNTKLQTLSCFNCGLTQLDVSKNTNLQYLYCDYNKLTQLDVSKNTKLQTVSCYNSGLAQLDVSKCSDYFELCAWYKYGSSSTNTLSTLWIRKGYNYTFIDREQDIYNSNELKSKFGTTVIEVD